MTRTMCPIKRGTLLLTIFFAFSLIICQAEQKIKMRKKQQAMKQEVAKYIPIGSSIEDAQRILEANGFKCMLREQRSFAEMNYGELVERQENMDFLWCDKEKGSWLFCDRRWQVAIVHKNGIVSDIFVSIGLICM
jgi:hypothetical protein